MLEFRIMGERPVGDLEQDNSIMYWKISGRKERACKKLKRKDYGKIEDIEDSHLSTV
jgi:hypothetical protein